MDVLVVVLMLLAHPKNCGVLTRANPGVLERVLETRQHYGYSWPEDAPKDADVLVATSDCGELGKKGFLVVPAVWEVFEVLVADCATPGRDQQRMNSLGLLADVNVEALVHQRACLVLDTGDLLWAY